VQIKKIPFYFNQPYYVSFKMVFRYVVIKLVNTVAQFYGQRPLPLPHERRLRITRVCADSIPSSNSNAAYKLIAVGRLRLYVVMYPDTHKN